MGADGSRINFYDGRGHRSLTVDPALAAAAVRRQPAGDVPSARLGPAPAAGRHARPARSSPAICRTSGIRTTSTCGLRRGRGHPVRLLGPPPQSGADAQAPGRGAATARWWSAARGGLGVAVATTDGHPGVPAAAGRPAGRGHQRRRRRAGRRLPGRARAGGPTGGGGGAAGPAGRAVDLRAAGRPARDLVTREQLDELVAEATGPCSRCDPTPATGRVTIEAPSAEVRPAAGSSSEPLRSGVEPTSRWQFTIRRWPEPPPRRPALTARPRDLQGVPLPRVA